MSSKLQLVIKIRLWGKEFSPTRYHKLRPPWVYLGLTKRSGTWSGKCPCCVRLYCGQLRLWPTRYKPFDRYRGNRIYWPLIDCQGLLNLLLVVKSGYGGATLIIGNQGLGRMNVYGGGMVNHTSLRVNSTF